MNKVTLHVYHDPGHGWVKAPKSLLKKLKISPLVSRFSYQRGDYAYLEEDVDWGLLDRALKAAGYTVVYKHHHSNNSSRIRNYADYRHVD